MRQRHKLKSLALMKKSPCYHAKDMKQYRCTRMHKRRRPRINRGLELLNIVMNYNPELVLFPGKEHNM